MNKYEYLSTQQIIESSQYPFTKGGLAYHLIKRKENGLNRAVRKIGKRLYLRKDLFEEWIESQAETVNEDK